LISRRKILDAIGILGALTVWPHGVAAQQAERVRRIGVLNNLAADDPEGRARLAAFVEAFGQLGWTDGRNVRIEIRWGEGDVGRTRERAAELAALAPDVILAIGGTALGQLLETTRTVPIVFTRTPDPVGSGFVASLARPGGNATGFTSFEHGIGPKWLQLLKEVAPYVTRVAALSGSTSPSVAGEVGLIRSAALSLGVEVSMVDAREPGEIERALAAFADGANGGLIVLPGASGLFNRHLIAMLAARHRLPAIYPSRAHMSGSGLISYGPDTIEPQRLAAAYVDRILKGAKPADLPVQDTSRYELAVNLKTAKALGLAIPQSILLRADEVIE
jgi:putative ABC transport system substrate-binding protein